MKQRLIDMFQRARGAQALQRGIAALKKLDEEEARELYILLDNILGDAKMDEKQTARRRFLSGRMP